MANRIKLTREQRIQLALDIAGGMTRLAAAEKYGVHVQTIYRMLKNPPEERSSRKLTPCPSIAAYRRHLKAGEPPCDGCNKEWAKYHKERKDAIKRGDWKKRKESQYRGVSWNRQRKRWRVTIRVNGVQKYIGSFSTELQAALAYDEAARNLLNNRAVLNFPERKSA